MRAPLPPDEDARLAELRSLRILDTSEEAHLDLVTKTAARLFRVPIVLITLVDANRQWFKSHCGLDFRETPRDHSFCAHALMTAGVLVIPDARKDPRFRDNPLVTGEPGIRFYAGAPLAGPRGSKLGTLCLIDRKPRSLDPGEVRLLEEFRDVVQDLMRERPPAPLAAETRIAQLLDAGGHGFALMARGTIVLQHNIALARMIGARTALTGQRLAKLVSEWPSERGEPIFADGVRFTVSTLARDSPPQPLDISLGRWASEGEEKCAAVVVDPTAVSTYTPRGA